MRYLLIVGKKQRFQDFCSWADSRDWPVRSSLGYNRIFFSLIRIRIVYFGIIYIYYRFIVRFPIGLDKYIHNYINKIDFTIYKIQETKTMALPPLTFWLPNVTAN